MRKRNFSLKFICLCLLFSFVGCGKTFETSIPSVSFSFSCNLSQSPYYKIMVAGQFLVVSKNVNGLHVGYGGLIVGKSIFSSDDSYLAYDASCPVEAQPNVVLSIVDDGLGTARCSHCGATFDLSNYGCRNDGKGGEVLRRYDNVSKSGNTLIIRN